MKNDFHFRPVEDRKSLDKLMNWIRPQGLNYSNWESWLDKTYLEIFEGYKEAIILETNGVVIGNSIFQPHKGNKWLYEFKNLRIHPKFRERHCGSFLVKEVEYRAKGKYSAIICDLKSTEKGIFNFLLRLGYTPIFEGFLYDNSNLDTVMIKVLDKEKNKIIHASTGFLKNDPARI